VAEEKRRIGGAGGGSDPGKSKSGAGRMVLAISIAVAVSAGGVTASGSATLTSGISSASSSSSGARGGSRVSNKDSQAAEARVVRQGFRVNAKFTSDAANCVEHSYGQVQNFFRQQPCTALHRAWFEVRDRQGDAVLVAVSWVQMPDKSSAAALKQLVDAPGTGNVTELSREQGKYRSVRYTGECYKSDLEQAGTVVVNAQAEPVARGAAGLLLTSIVTNAVH
jgi:hypothetical protein